MSLTTTVRALVQAGATPEMILAVVEAHEATVADALAHRRARDAERQKAKRERDCHVTSRDVTVTERDSRDPPPHVGERAQVVTPFSSSLRSEEVITPVTPNGVTAPTGAKNTRGSRLPDDWRPDEDGRRYAVETLGPNIDPERELDRFRDYWRAVPGAKGRKTDWPATWRNWVRRASENAPSRKAHERPHPNQPTAREDRLGRSLAGLMAAVNEREPDVGGRHS